MANIPAGLAREHLLQAFADFDAGVPHAFADSTRFDVLHEGRHYPPKAIVGLAARHILGAPLQPDDFSGGEGSKCFQVLRSFGFEIVPKVDEGSTQGEKRFTWIPIYKELAQKVLTFEENQSALIALLREMDRNIPKVLKLNDKDAEGNRFDLQEIDLLTFFSNFNRPIKDETRQAILRTLKSEWGLSADVPSDFDGLPVLNPQSSWFFAYHFERKPEDVPLLWRFAHEVLEKTPESFDHALFNQCLQIKEVGLAKLTSGMFWLCPDTYLAADSKNLQFLQKRGITLRDYSAASYFQYVTDVRAKLGDDFPSLSYAAYLETKQAEIKNPASAVAVQPQYWMIGTGADGKCWPEFLEQEIIAIDFWIQKDLQKFSSREEIKQAINDLAGDTASHRNDTLACWEFVHELQQGDIVFAKRGVSTMLGYGRITSDYLYDPMRSEYKHTRKVEWIKTGNWDWQEAPFVTKTLTNITRYEGYAERLLAHLEGGTLTPQTDLPTLSVSPYTIQSALGEIFMSEAQISNILSRLKRKKNLILQGPPGVGKTFIARRLAYLLMGVKDASRVEMVQFHQSYAYEDFIQGIRADGTGGFKLKSGIFYNFCRRAQSDPANAYFFIIDEINRGNLSKIFGEMMMLIEHDKRGEDHAIPLTYAENAKERFYIPPNLYLIGTMNTADHSLAMVDYALRRRFAFYSLSPGFEQQGFQTTLHSAGASPELIQRIRTRIGALNDLIASDSRNLGAGFCIGHSFFCPPNGHKADDEWYREIVEAEIQPLLEEYWMDDEDKVKEQITKLLS